MVAEAGRPLTVPRPRPGWSKQDPDDWWHAVEGALDDLVPTDGGDLSAVAGIGLTGQMHRAALLGADD